MSSLNSEQEKKKKKGHCIFNSPRNCLNSVKEAGGWRDVGLSLRIGGVIWQSQLLFLFLPEPALWPCTNNSFLYFVFLICKAQISHIEGTKRNQLGLRVSLHWLEIGFPGVPVNGNKAQWYIHPKFRCCFSIFISRLS